MNVTKNKSNSVDFNISNKLLYNLHSQRRSGEFCDVKFCIADTVCSVHSCVVASFSPYLYEKFAHVLSIGSFDTVESCKEDNVKLTMWSIKNPIQLHVISKDNDSSSLCAECLLKVLDFMYVGKIHICKEHVNHIQQLGKMLDISELFIICDKFLKNNKGKEIKYLGLVRTVDTVVEISLSVVIKPKISCESKASQEAVNEPKLQETSPNVERRETSIIEESPGSTEKDQACQLDSASMKTSSPIRTSEANSKKVKQAANSDPYMCLKCSLQFANLSLLRQHHQQAHRGRLYTCYTCRFSARKAYSLFKHLQTANHNESVCSLCMFEASSSEELNVHIQQHNHPKPFFCDVCNARFQTRTSANLHYPTHSTEAPYSCSICQKSFKWKHGLQNHMVVHGTEKKHLCAQCGFSTRHLRTFHTHELTHTGPLLKCPTPGCNFQTAIKKYLSSHLSTHNKEKPYQCEICGRAFSQAKNLYRHAEKHDKTAFVEKCYLCLYQTTRIDKLATHFKKHHPEGDFQELIAQRKKRKSEYLRNKISSSLKTSNSLSSRALVSKNPKNTSSISLNPTQSNLVEIKSVESSLVPLGAGGTDSLILDSGTQCQDFIIVTTVPSSAILSEDGTVNCTIGNTVNNLQFVEEVMDVDGLQGREITLVPIGQPQSVLLDPAGDAHNLCITVPFQHLDEQSADCHFEGLLEAGEGLPTPTTTEILPAPSSHLQVESVTDNLVHVQELSFTKNADACITLSGEISAQYTKLLENLERESFHLEAGEANESLPGAILNADKEVPFCQQAVVTNISESESNFFSDPTQIVSDRTLVEITNDSSSFVTTNVELLDSDDVRLDANSSIFNSLQELPWFE